MFQADSFSPGDVVPGGRQNNIEQNNIEHLNTGGVIIL